MHAIFFIDFQSLIIILAVFFLIFLYLALRSFRGVPIDEHPLCRKCKYDLIGNPPPYTTCPECGHYISDSSQIVTGNRKRKPVMTTFYLLLALLTITPLGYKFSNTNLNPYKPLSLLTYEVMNPDMSFNSSAAYNELVNRINNKNLTPEQAEQLAASLMQIIFMHDLSLNQTAINAVQNKIGQQTQIPTLTNQTQQHHKLINLLTDNIFEYYRPKQTKTQLRASVALLANLPDSLKQTYSDCLFDAIQHNNIPQYVRHVFEEHALILIMQKSNFELDETSLKQIATDILNQLDQPESSRTYNKSLAGPLLITAHRRNLLTQDQQQKLAQNLISFTFNTRAYTHKNKTQCYYQFYKVYSKKFDNPPHLYPKLPNTDPYANFTYKTIGCNLDGKFYPIKDRNEIWSSSHEEYSRIRFDTGYVGNSSTTDDELSHLPLKPDQKHKFNLVIDLDFNFPDCVQNIKTQITTQTINLTYSLGYPEIQLIKNDQIAKIATENIRLVTPEKDLHFSDEPAKQPFQQTIIFSKVDRVKNKRGYYRDVSQEVQLKKTINHPLSYSIFVEYQGQQYDTKETIMSDDGRVMDYHKDKFKNIPQSLVGKRVTVVFKPNIKEAQTHSLTNKILANELRIENVLVVEYIPATDTTPAQIVPDINSQSAE
ncbi:hypothetical protein JD969_14370 [Planctomycetota bacterium]|nr:hypothetical protein JD969_14370 [Planctomycetota bacterium]